MTKTAEYHEMAGTWENKPSRRRPPSPKATLDFGTPPASFSPDERKCWRELEHNSAVGVMMITDRWIAETACVLQAKFRRREKLTSAEHSLLVTCICKMGMTPVDRSKILLAATAGNIKKNNPYAEFAAPEVVRLHA